ncbi:MAG: phosphatidylglycerophosphate synthase [Sodalis sp. Ffu]|nr:MAG: phosphatidylglycerophosphate synthase [Sodalis sp. Ffu]
MQLNIPTWLSLLRVITMPFFVMAFYMPFQWGPLICTIIFIIAAVTDWLDGFLARRWKQITRFGTFLDPVADKVMIAITLVLIVEHFHAWWITLPAATIIAREIIILALREWMAEIGKHSNIAVSWTGKIKTTAQMLAMVALLWRTGELMTEVGIIALYIAAVLTYWSMFQYLYATRHDLFER